MCVNPVLAHIQDFIFISMIWIHLPYYRTLARYQLVGSWLALCRCLQIVHQIQIFSPVKVARLMKKWNLPWLSIEMRKTILAQVLNIRSSNFPSKTLLLSNGRRFQSYARIIFCKIIMSCCRYCGACPDSFIKSPLWYSLKWNCTLASIQKNILLE